MSTNEQLIRAVQFATRRLTSADNFDALLRDVLAISVKAVEAEGGTIYLHDPANHRLRFQHVLPAEAAKRMPFADIPDDFGVAGQAFQEKRTILSNSRFIESSSHPEIEAATGIKIRSMLTVPLMMEDERPIGVVQIINKISGEFTANDVSVMDTLAAVSTMAYHNSQLLEEQARASSLLGMGRVGHDIGNLAASLFASIAYFELAVKDLRQALQSPDGIPTARQRAESIETMVADLKLSADRLVRYSRLISDLAAGKELRPQKQLASLAETIRTGAELLEMEGRRNRVAIVYDIDDDAPPFLHDDLYMLRIVQNLVGNAIKATREKIPDEKLKAKAGSNEDSVLGEVLVRYRYINHRHRLEVHDSGPGMSKETIRAILSGRARSQWDKASGSGLGTRIILELAATHNGKVSIQSRPGEGTTFVVELPDDES